MVPLRFMTAALQKMLKMRPRFDTVLVRFKLVVPRHPPHAVFLMNRLESGWIRAESGCQLYHDSSRMPTNGHYYTYGATKE